MRVLRFWASALRCARPSSALQNKSLKRILKKSIRHACHFQVREFYRETLRHKTKLRFRYSRHSFARQWEASRRWRRIQTEARLRFKIAGQNRVRQTGPPIPSTHANVQTSTVSSRPWGPLTNLLCRTRHGKISTHLFLCPHSPLMSALSKHKNPATRVLQEPPS